MQKTFPSKISYTLLIIIGFILFIPAIVEMYNHGLNEQVLMVCASILLVFVFLLYIFFSTKYTIIKDTLLIKSGFLVNMKIDINTINSIHKTNSILSSPAASFDRILVSFGQYDEVIISPKDKLGFIKAIKQINPSIVSDLL